jgi:hypothetical protein
MSSQMERVGKDFQQAMEGMELDSYIVENQRFHINFFFLVIVSISLKGLNVVFYWLWICRQQSVTDE